MFLYSIEKKPCQSCSFLELFFDFFVSVIIVKDKMQLFLLAEIKKAPNKEPVKFCYIIYVTAVTF